MTSSPKNSWQKPDNNTPNPWKNTLPVVVKNPELSRWMNDLFRVFKEGNPDKSSEALIGDIENRFTLFRGQGILNEFINQGGNVNFATIGFESFSLQELETLELGNLHYLTENDPLRLWIEKALVTHIKEEFKKGLSKETAASFWDIVYYTNSLSELLTAIKLFPESLNHEKHKSEFLKFIENFQISLNAIKSALNKINPPIDTINLNTKSFQNWTKSEKIAFDGIITKLIISRLKTRIEAAKKLTEDIAGVFEYGLPSLNILTKEYPIDYEGLWNKAVEKYPELKEEIIHIGQQIEEEGGSDLLSKSLDNVFRKIYLKEMEEKDTKMANILSLLHKNNFDFSLLNNDPVLRAYFLERLSNVWFEELKKSGALETFWDANKFKVFIKDLLNFSKTSIDINGTKIAIEKTFRAWIPWGNLDLWDLPTLKSLPMHFRLSGINNLNLSLEDRDIFDAIFAKHATDADSSTPNAYTKIDLEGKDSGKLLWLFLSGAPSLLDHYTENHTNTERIQDFINKLNKQGKIEQEKEKLDDEDTLENEKRHDEGKEKTKEEIEKAFLEDWESIKGENKSEDKKKGFKKWAILYLPIGTSDLPPFSEGEQDRLRVEISDVDWGNQTFKAKFYGTQLQLPSNMEGKESPHSYSFKTFKKFFIDNKDFWTDKPFKILTQSWNFEETVKRMQGVGIIEENTLGNAKIEGNKLMLTTMNNEGKETTEEVHYFWTSGSADDKDKVLYKIKINADNMVNVSSTPFVGLENDKKSFTFKKKMSYPDFLLFISQKKLTPKTETAAEQEKQKITDITSSKKRGQLRWISLHSLAFSVKSIWKKINEGLDKYQKAQDEACLDWLTSDVGIYNKLNKLIGWVWPSVASNLSELHDEAISAKEKKNWKSIENWITIFKSVEFPDIFAEGKDPASGERLKQLDLALGKWKKLKDILISWTCVINNDTLRPIVAAAMIANLKQGKGLYRGMSEYDNQGLWVKTLLGPEHYARYMQYKRKCQAEIDSGTSDADQLRDLLVNSEVNYIVRNIQNAHGKDKYFGSVNDSNSQMLKKIYSNEFANQLNTAAREVTGQSGVEWAYNKYKQLNTFNVAEEEFKKCIKSSRIESWLGALKRMGELAKKSEQLSTFAAAMSYVTMSGILNKYTGKETMTRFDGMARSLMLPTAFFTDKPFHQRYAWYILDQVPIKPKFSDTMKKKGIHESDFSQYSGQVPYWDFLSELMKRWMANTDAINDYFASLKINDHEGDQILNKVKEVLWEKNPDNLDANLRSKPKITGYYALNATPATIDQNKDYNKSWFTGKDEDERNDKAAFWKSVLEDLKKIEKKASPEFFLKQFKTWFAKDGFADINDPENVSMLRTIRDVNDRIGTEIKFYDKTYDLEVKFSSQYSEYDVEQLIWYLFKGKVLRQWSCQPPEEFDAVLDFFVKYFTNHVNDISSEPVLRSVFGKGSTTVEESKAEKLVPWNEYEKYIGKDDRFFTPQEEFDPDTSWDLPPEQQQRQLKAWKKRYYRSDAFINRRLVEMEKQMKRLNIAGYEKLTSKELSENIILKPETARPSA